MKRFLLYVLVSFCTGLSVHSQIGFQYLFCGNTLTRTYIQELNDNKTAVEIVLNRQAKPSKIELSAELLPGWSLETISGFPVNFSNSFVQNFIISDGPDKRQVSMTVKQIKSRTAPFNLNFSSSYPVNSWNLSTTGWVGCGITQTDTGDVELSCPGSAFLMAFTGNGELLSFDVKCKDGAAFSGIFSVEASKTGIDDWSPLKIMDNCTAGFTGEIQRIYLRLPAETSFLRFVLHEGEDVQPVLLNAFSVGPYNGEPVDNDPVSFVQSHIYGQYAFYNSYADAICFSDVLLNGEYKFRIEDLSGRIYLTGDIIDAFLPVGLLPAGYYILTGTWKGQVKFTSKFVKIK